ncbi:MAG: CapA family protein, partial [Gemmatimonadales bacterium]
MSARSRGSAPRRAIAPLGALLLFALLACPRGPAPEAPAGPAPARRPPAEPAPPADTIRAAVPAPVAAERAVRICAGGDVLLGNNLDTLWAARAAARLGHDVSPFPEPDSLLAPLHRLVADADIVLLNVEGAIGEGPAPRKCRPGSTRCYAFRQPSTTAAALRRVAGDAAFVANLANNHAMDAGYDGFTATVNRLRQVGAQVTGADTLA